MERFLDDRRADRMLGRDYRSPCLLPRI